MSTNARGRACIAEETCATHIQAATDLHRAHMRLITAEQAGTKEKEEAGAALGRKRKAADEASDDFIYFVSKAPRDYDPICADYVPTSPGCLDSDSDESDDVSPRIGANGAPLPLKWF